ncbi:MAG: hypothetical protein J6Y79_05435 [Paludibacteraceae bacterium]|nr:hypothetical protein [Paludibacteraceae bacterium]
MIVRVHLVVDLRHIPEIFRRDTQQTVVIERPGILTDLASAAGAIVALPAAVEGIVVGSVEAAGSLFHVSTQIVVVPPARAVPVPIIVAPAPVMVAPPVVVKTAPVAVPTTTIVTTHSNGTVTTVTRQASAYELGPVILPPVAPTNRVGTSPLVNPYVYRPR